MLFPKYDMIEGIFDIEEKMDGAETDVHLEA
jgi:hypothetical protein